MKEEYGQRSVFLLRLWENLEKKMADYRNHRRFSLRCLKSEVVPVSIRLKTNMKTSKGFQIIRRAEKQLLNERIRSVNNTLEMLMLRRGTCIEELKKIIDLDQNEKTFEECSTFIKRVTEYRHHQVMNRQRQKFEKLERKNMKNGHSNQGQDTCMNNSKKTADRRDSKNNWVINLSKTPLTIEQERLLSRGPKFVIRPRKPPVGEYFAAIEQACTKLNPGEADELCVEVKKTLKKAQNRSNTPSNITREEFQALNDLKRDGDRVVLTADKGVALVVMEKRDYIQKAEDLLNTSTYKKIPEDPTIKQKNKLVNILKRIKNEKGLNEDTYRKLYPTGAVSSKFYGLPKVHKPGNPLRPIVSSTGTATYQSAKELARILKPLVGNSTHHVQNTRDFVEQIQETRLKQGECIISYDVAALFTSVPIQPVINIIKEKLAKDTALHQRTSMSIDHITTLLEFCLRSTTFVFQGQYYQQMEGAAMGSPLSPIVANIFMESFEQQALDTSPHPPSLWKRYVDDTFVIQEEQHQEEFLQHINSLDPNIKFTAETTRADGSMPFLDALVTPQDDGSLATTVYRKPTHTNQYVQWDSHHAISNKFSIISSLLHRAKNICSSQQLLDEEHSTIQQALLQCNYPNWAINRTKLKMNTPKSNNRSNSNKTINKGHITVSYEEGLSESVKNICKRYGIEVHLKSGKSIKDELVAPKDKDHLTKKSGIIYRYKCDRLECDEEYIGETSRTFGERYKEHLKAPSPIYDHYNISGHNVTLNNFSIVGREEQNLSRLIKESMFIRVNNPSLNKNIGKYHLPHIWDEVLINNKELKLK